MNRRRIVRFIIIWFFVVCVVLIGRIYFEIQSDESDFNEAYTAYGITAITEQDGSYYVLDIMNDEGLMSSVRSWSVNRNVEFEQVAIDEDLFLYVLVSYKDNTTDLIARNIVRFDSNLKTTGESGWFILNWNGPVSDMGLYEGVIYIAQIGIDNLVYEYDQKIADLKDAESTGYKKLPQMSETPIFYADKTKKVPEDKEIKDIYVYKDAINILTTDTEEENPKETVLVNARNLRKSIVLTPGYLVRKFIYAYYIAFIIYIAGIALFIAIPRLLKERNRFLMALIIWESCLAILLILFWLGYNRLFRDVPMWIMFVAGTAIGILLLYWESRDLRQLTKVVFELTEKGRVPDKPEVYGKDIRYVWNGLIELGNRMDRLSRAKQVIYDTLNRYVPMGVNLMAETGAVTDLNSGDYKEGYFPVALVGGKFLRENKLDGSIMVANDSIASYFMKFVSKYQEFKKCILLGMSPDMSFSEFLFTGSNKSLHSFGLDFYSMVGKHMPAGDNFKTVVVIHFCDLKYGVIGTSSVMHQFVHSREIVDIQRQFEFFKEINVDFMVTGEVMEREVEKPTVRYIGAMELDSRLTPLELYQVLDHMPQSKRHLYLENTDSFNKGIEFLKEKNFYLARNTFAEVLHNVPYDGVAKYYLYLCEKNLDLPTEEISIMLGK